MNVVIKNPVKEGKYPVTAAAPARSNSEMYAQVCSRPSNSKKTAAKDRKPGISLIDCCMPISRPVKDKTSTAKLLTINIHGANDICMIAAIVISNIAGDRHPIAFGI